MNAFLQQGRDGRPKMNIRIAKRTGDRDFRGQLVVRLVFERRRGVAPTMAFQKISSTSFFLSCSQLKTFKSRKKTLQ